MTRWTRWRSGADGEGELGARLDIRGFFDTIDHEWLMKFVEHRIADRRVLRLIQKWLKREYWKTGNGCGYRGDATGGGISPLLANIYLHYAFDLWVRAWGHRARGEVIVVRYADDIVIGFQYRSEAERFWQELGTTALVRAGAASRQDAPAAVWPVCG